MLKKILSLFIIVVVVVSAEIYTFAYYTNICEYPGICKIVEINLKTKTINIVQEEKNNRSFTHTFTFKNDLVVDVGGEKKTIADIKVGDIVTIESGEDNEVKNIAIKISRKPTSVEQKVINAKKEARNAKKEARKRWEAEQKRIDEEEKRKDEKEKRNEFVKKNSVEEWPDISEFSVNPFIYEGKIVALRVSFREMQTATQGIFADLIGMGSQLYVVSDIPKGMFKESGTLVLAGKVLGKTELQVPLLGLMRVPHLKFVGIHYCQDYDCNDIIPEKKQTPVAATPVEELKKNEEFSAEYKQGILYAKNEQYEKAIAEWLKALEKNKENTEIYYNLGIAYTIVGKLDDAIAVWQKALTINPLLANLHYVIGLTYKEKGNFELAEASFKKTMEIDPNYPDAKNVLEKLYLSQEEAKKQQIPSLQEEGSNALKNKNWNAAVQAYKKLLEIEPDNVEMIYDANMHLGSAYTMLNEFDLSIKHLTKAQQLKPAEYQPCYLMGVAYARKGDKDRAMESLQDAINRRPDDLLVSDLGKDTNLPEDFKQDQRFKGMLAKLTFKKLISSVKDTNLFDNHFQEFPNRFEEVWDAVDYALKKQREKIIQSDKQTGIIITDMTFDWDGEIYNKYYILVEKRNESLSVINFKLLTYHKIKNKSTTMEEGFVKWLKSPELKPANSSYTNQVAMSFLECVRKRLKNSK